MAEAIVSIVVGRLTDLLIREAQLLHGLKDEIEQVVTKLRQIKTFLPDADSRISDHRIRVLLSDIRELAYDAEHAVESFIVKASSTGKTIQWMNRVKFSRKIRDLQRKMSLLFNYCRDYNIRSTKEFPESSTSSYKKLGKLKRFYSYKTVEPDIFVGFQGDVDQLVQHLVNDSDDCYSLIAICGMGGLGKTTLAQKIYNHSTIKSYFSGLAWASISQKWQKKLVLQRILICLVPEKKKEILTFDEDKLVEHLVQIQQRKKCLIVLDDIWSTSAWDSLKAAFTAKNSISKLMLTSRNVGVAKHVNPNGLIHQPVLLSLEQSWDLLQLKALPRGDILDNTRDVERMEKLGRGMVRNCGGLPLAIVILGGVLVTKPSMIEWEKVYEDSLLSLNKGEGLGEGYQRELLDVLVSSYHNLPPQLKPCFLYLGKYGEDACIEAESLYQIWIAEGMILSSDKKEGETMMEVAESYLGELVHKSMVQVTFNDINSSLTKFKSCSLHDLMRDLSLSQAKAEDFFKVLDIREGNDFYLNTSADSSFSYARQLVVHFDKKYTSKEANSYFVKKVNHQRYRSMLLFNEFAVSLPRVLWSRMASFKLLRILSLERVDFHIDTVSGALSSIRIGRVLGSMVYLRYLSVRKTSLLIFPSIQNMVLLQTLKLDTLESTYFPPWLSKNITSNLGHLQHLCLPHSPSHRKNLKLRFDGLSKLEILENFDSDWCEVKDLPKLISLQKLKLKVKDKYNVEDMKYLTALALSPSSCLRYLAFSIDIGDVGLQSDQDDLRKLLWDHNYNLRELRINGKLPELDRLFGQQQLHNIHVDVTLICITKLYLWGSNLEEDPMPVIEKIPTLRELNLRGEAFVGKDMVCSATGFPKLTVFYLWHLPQLVKWRVEEGCMPILSYLNIGYCPKLEGIPEGLKFLNSLQRLVLQGMHSDFCSNLQVVNGEQGPDFHKVAHVPSFEFYEK